MNFDQRGGVDGIEPDIPPSPREVWLLQRSEGKLGAKLGKTTGWIHRTTLKKHGVHMLAGVTYEKIDDQGLHIRIDDKKKTLAVDNIVLCAGQISESSLYEALKAQNSNVHCIGGAKLAGELDAKRAIDEGTRLAAQL